MLCLILVDVKWTNSLLSHEQIEIWLNQSPLFCCSVKGNIFVDLQITDDFHSQKSIIILGVSNYKSVQKKEENLIFAFKSVCIHLRESV